MSPYIPTDLYMTDSCRDYLVLNKVSIDRYLITQSCIFFVETFKTLLATNGLIMSHNV